LYHYAGNNPVRYTDPDGRILANIVAGAVGAAVGAIVGATTTYMAGGDANAIKAATIGGAVGGATAGFTLGASLIVGATVAVGTGAVVAAGSDIGLDLHDGKEISGESVLKAAIGGATGGLAGFAAGHATGKAIENARETTAKQNDVFPENPDNFNPEGLTRRDFKNGEIKKWMNNDNKAIYEWNKDPKYGDHYHFTPDGKNRVPGVTGDTHLLPGEPVP
jgi:hypothetical protein